MNNEQPVSAAFYSKHYATAVMTEFPKQMSIAGAGE
jgi:hypothetical protein